MKNILINVLGMTCSACSNHVEKYLSKQKGIIDVSVNLVMGTALIHYEEDLDIETISKYINDSGYKYGGIYKINDEQKDNSKKYLIILGIILIIMMYLSMSHMIGLSFFDITKYSSIYSLSLFILTIPFLIFGCDILIKGIKNIIRKSPNMDSLVSLGVITSFIYSFVNMILIINGNKDLIHHLYFESCSMIIYFVKLGRVIDHNSKEKTKDAIKDLVRVTPEYAIIKTKNGEKKITIDEVKIGDILTCRSGEKIAVDGEIIKGIAHFDESFITGESIPVKKKMKDGVLAGSINYDGVVEYKALKIGPKSTISEMVHLVMNSLNSKMKITRITDKISSYFVPMIILIAVITFIIYLLLGHSFNESLIRLVTVLVVACPCAIGLATPLAIVTSIGTLSKNNLLVKSSETLEIIPKIDTIVFDKTGTLTNGKLEINKIYNYSKYNDKDLLNIISNLENNSIHPIANAFKKYLKNTLEIKNYQELPGIGIKGKINTHEYILGNNKILKNIVNDKQDDEKELLNKGNSIIYVLEDNNIIALIGVRDTIRSDAINTIKKLQDKKIYMLSGDNKITSDIIAKEIGISNVQSEVSPKNKIEFIKELKNNNHYVIMVGDGINDAASLVEADVGISFKSSTDIASNSANVIITNDKLKEIITLIRISNKTVKIIKENLFWAFFYNILMIPIAIGLFKDIKINPMIASFMMMLSSLTVVFNTLRLRRDKDV